MDYSLNHISLFLLFFLVIFSLLPDVFFFVTVLVTVHKFFIVIILEITLSNFVAIFLAVRAVLVLPVPVVTLLNRVSTFLALYTVIVLFYPHTINNLVDVCTTLFARYLELRFNIEGFFIFS